VLISFPDLSQFKCSKRVNTVFHYRHIILTFVQIMCFVLYDLKKNKCLTSRAEYAPLTFKERQISTWFSTKASLHSSTVISFPGFGGLFETS